MDQPNKEYSHLDIVLALQRIEDRMDHADNTTATHREWLKEELSQIKDTHKSHDARITCVEKKQWTFAGVAATVAMFGGTVIEKLIK